MPSGAARRLTVLAPLVLLVVLAMVPSARPAGAPHAPVLGASVRTDAAAGPSLDAAAAVARPTSAITIRPDAVSPAYGGSESEPAPMGITDFGVNGAGDPYSYATPIWRGTVTIGSLRTTSGGSGANAYMSFQLNVVLVFGAGANNYTYWVQNVVSIDTSGNTILFENNIWNWSSETPKLTSSEITGNGTVNYESGIGYWYAYGDSYDGSGNGIRLSYPMTLQVEVTTGFYDGVPRVNFLYNDQGTWVSYDNVSFNDATDWTDYGFVVDGYAYAPIGPGYIFIDAEWDFSGLHYGYTDLSSNLTMSLEYWNGHNFQEPPNAFDFGGDTDESMQDVVTGFGDGGGGGLLTDHLTAGSSSSLAMLYDSDQVGTLHAASPLYPNGTLTVGTRNISFSRGLAELTLGPGTYPVVLWENGAQVGLEENLTISAGATTDVALPLQAPTYEIAYYANGLPAGTAWSVSLGNETNRSAGGALGFSVPNGTYLEHVTGVPGYGLSGAYSTWVVVNGSDLAYTLNWSVFTFRYSFLAVGLPGATPWSLAITGAAALDGSGGTPVATMLANGTYPYRLSTVAWYAPEPSSGNLTVADEGQNLEFQFDPALAAIDGSVSPANATLTVNGLAVFGVAANGSFALSEMPGVYTIAASAPCFASNATNATATAGNTTLVRLDLTAAPNGCGSGSTGPPGGGSRSTGSGSAAPDWTYAYLGVGVVGLVAIAVLALVLRRPAARR